MYTEIVAAIELNGGKKRVPQSVVKALEWLTGDDFTSPPEGLPVHPFFDKERAGATLRCDSYYFAGDTRSTFRYDDIAGKWFLTVRSNLKNYDGEIESFLEWIAPYSQPRDVKDDGTYFVGYKRYEENDDPTLIYFTEDGKVVYREVVPAEASR